MTILDTIVERKRQELQNLPDGTPSVADVRRAIDKRGGTRDFLSALKSPPKGDIALIAEVKKASPSKGVIREDFDPVEIAKIYESAGATCLSVLTDRDFFQGDLSYLSDIRKEVALPLLRKDFIIDPRQILEAVEWGADAILLIVAILDQEHLSDLHQLAVESGLSVLVEVHDETELQRAIHVGARLIGVNNRNLKDFTVDLGTTGRIAKGLTFDGIHLLVAESGIHTRADVSEVKKAGADAILVGESLMKHQDIATKVSDLITPCE